MLGKDLSSFRVVYTSPQIPQIPQMGKLKAHEKLTGDQSTQQLGKTMCVSRDDDTI